MAVITGDTARGTTLFDVNVHRTAWADIIKSAQGIMILVISQPCCLWYTTSTARSSNTEGASQLKCLLRELVVIFKVRHL